MKFFDFFAGIGGFRLGMEMAGHECVGHCEIDKYANMSYMAMHKPKESEVYFGEVDAKIKRVRKLTPRECFRLQGWTDDYFAKAQLVNSDSQLYKQAGNGVTVNVICAIAEKMK